MGTRVRGWSHHVMGGMHAYTTPYLTALTTYFSYAVLILFGHTRDFYRRALALIMGRAFLAPSSDASKTSDSLGSLANERAGAVGRSGVQCGDMAPMLEEGDDFSPDACSHAYKTAS